MIVVRVPARRIDAAGHTVETDGAVAYLRLDRATPLGFAAGGRTLNLDGRPVEADAGAWQTE